MRTVIVRRVNVGSTSPHAAATISRLQDVAEAGRLRLKTHLVSSVFSPQSAKSLVL